VNTETGLILGVPVDNLTLSDAVRDIFHMIDCHAMDNDPRYVATVNVDFIVNTLSWVPGRTAHPELLDILRKAEMVTADGMPVVWAARLLGTRLKERVAGADLVPALAREAAKRGRSVYFLGGSGDVAEKAAEHLQQIAPGLIVAGCSAPFVHIQGRKMADAEEDDRAVVDAVNKARPDILFLGFGNPKQEVWFERNRHRLKVGVAIGIGGTYEFITGRVKRAPMWMQRSGLEWIFRITQDPARLFKRYFVGFFKFGTMILPSILYLKYRTFLLRMSLDKRDVTPSSPGEHATSVPVNVIALDQRLDSAWVGGHGPDLQEKIGEGSAILDFSHVSFVDSTGIGFLVRLYRQATRGEVTLRFCSLQKPVRRTFELIRVLDLFKEILFESLEEAVESVASVASVASAGAKTGFFYVRTESPSCVVFQLFGKFDSDQAAAMDLPALVRNMNGKHCIIDAKELSFAGNNAVMFFFKLQKQVLGRGRCFVICNLQESVMRMLRVTKVDRLFFIKADLESAEKSLLDQDGPCSA